MNTIEQRKITKKTKKQNKQERIEIYGRNTIRKVKTKNSENKTKKNNNIAKHKKV